MADMINPALGALLQRITPELVLAEVRILRLPQGFELRHSADQAAAASDLRRLQIGELRVLAQVTAGGAFRPLKSAPTLQRGWCAMAAGPAELDLALNHLYPGAVADWHAALTTPEAVTDYRQFAQRQTGMYRITQRLNDSQAGRVVRSVCPRQFCLKRRLWTVGSMAADPVSEKSLIPCLEPCAVLLEFARKAMRWEQEKKEVATVSPSEAASLKQALRAALGQPAAAGLRDADFDQPTNPHRLQWILDKLDQNCCS